MVARKKERWAGVAEPEPQEYAVTGRRATYQDVLAAPPHKVAEVVDGRLSLMPRPRSLHGRAGSRLGVLIGGPFDGDGSVQGVPGGWWIIDEPEVHFGTPPDEDILVPDMAGWRRERMPEFPDVAYFTMVPDGVCEVLSKSTREHDLGSKSDVYARAGIPHFWVIDPKLRSLEAYELQDGTWQSIASLSGDDAVSVPPFAAISFPLAELWRPRTAKRMPR